MCLSQMNATGWNTCGMESSNYVTCIAEWMSSGPLLAKRVAAVQDHKDANEASEVTNRFTSTDGVRLVWVR